MFRELELKRGQARRHERAAKRNQAEERRMVNAANETIAREVNLGPKWLQGSEQGQGQGQAGILP